MTFKHALIRNSLSLLAADQHDVLLKKAPKSETIENRQNPVLEIYANERKLLDCEAFMSETKHLAGPWSYAFDHDGDHAIFSAAGRRIAVTDGIHDLPLEVDAANARLIAAAPELLAMLKLAERGHRNLVEMNLIPKSFHSDALLYADQYAEIIAKAEGRS